MTQLKQKEYTVELNTEAGENAVLDWYYRDYTSTCDPLKKVLEPKRVWRITYVKHDEPTAAIENFYCTHLEQYLQFSDLLEESGYSYKEIEQDV